MGRGQFSVDPMGVLNHLIGLAKGAKHEEVLEKAPQHLQVLFEGKNKSAEDKMILSLGKAFQERLQQAVLDLDSEALQLLLALRYNVLPDYGPTFEVDWREPVGINYLAVLEKHGAKGFEFAVAHRMYPLDSGFDEISGHPDLTREHLEELVSLLQDCECYSEAEDLSDAIAERFGEE